MSIQQPWLHDRSLLAVPAGWRRYDWTARMVAAEHGLLVSVSVAWAPPDAWGTPALAIAGDVVPTSTLPAQRREIQRAGFRAATRCAARASRFCMACGGEDFPSQVRLRSGEFIDVIAVLCVDCEIIAEEEGGAFWPTISRFDPLADEEEENPPWA